MSILKCNRLENTSTASGGLDIDVSGKVRVTTLADSAGNTLNITRQVLQAVKTDTFSTSSTSFVDITDLSVDITPSSASSKVLALFSVTGGTSAGSGWYVNLVRDSTDVAIGDTAGSRVRSTVSNYSVPTIQLHSFGFEFLDSPATTSQVTYKLQLKSQSGFTSYINRSGTDTDNDIYPRAVSSITVMEVAA